MYTLTFLIVTTVTVTLSAISHFFYIISFLHFPLLGHLFSKYSFVFTNNICIFASHKH